MHPFALLFVLALAPQSCVVDTIVQTVGAAFTLDQTRIYVSQGHMITPIDRPDLWRSPICVFDEQGTCDSAPLEIDGIALVNKDLLYITSDGSLWLVDLPSGSSHWVRALAPGEPLAVECNPVPDNLVWFARSRGDSAVYNVDDAGTVTALAVGSNLYSAHTVAVRGGCLYFTASFPDGLYRTVTARVDNPGWLSVASEPVPTFNGGVTDAAAPSDWWCSIWGFSSWTANGRVTSGQAIQDCTAAPACNFASTVTLRLVKDLSGGVIVSWGMPGALVRVRTSSEKGLVTSGGASVEYEGGAPAYRSAQSTNGIEYLRVTRVCGGVEEQ